MKATIQEQLSRRLLERAAKTQRAAREAIGRLLAIGIDWHETDPDKPRGSLSGPVHGSAIEIIKDYRGR